MPRAAIVTLLLALVVVVAGAAVVDVLAIDRTSGGTPPDYRDFQGDPIDWDSHDWTERGFLRRGLILNSHLDCATGMLSVEAFGVEREFRPLSERALHVHRPREACLRHGFEPGF